MVNDRHFIEGDTFDDIYQDVLSNLILHPQYICSPRGSKVKENIGVTLKLNNPRARLITAPHRAANYGFGVGEFLWYWQGKQDLETMVYYNKRMKDFSDDGRTLTSAYGHRLRTRSFPSSKNFVQGSPEISQWEACKRTLLGDPDSRRALLLINFPGDQTIAAVSGSKDVPCTLSLQFFVRNNKLELHAHMRSNDVLWGLTYDLFSFTLFQECMLLELKQNAAFKDLELGAYYHTAGSLHVYEAYFKQAEDICGDYINRKQRPIVMAPLDIEGLSLVCKAEEDLRLKKVPSLDGLHLLEADYTTIWMLDQLNEHRKKRDAEEKKVA